MVSDYPSPFLVGLEDNSFMEPKKAMITDEMVEKAAKAIIERYTKVSDDPLHTESRMRMAMPDARAALEAVAPQLIAQGMREAAQICDGYIIPGHVVAGPNLVNVGKAILARAEELDPK